jgi:hypothetical protein
VFRRRHWSYPFSFERFAVSLSTGRCSVEIGMRLDLRQPMHPARLGWC